jgi:hypothetical protein
LSCASAVSSSSGITRRLSSLNRIITSGLSSQNSGEHRLHACTYLATHITHTIRHHHQNCHPHLENARWRKHRPIYTSILALTTVTTMSPCRPLGGPSLWHRLRPRCPLWRGMRKERHLGGCLISPIIGRREAVGFVINSKRL